MAKIEKLMGGLEKLAGEGIFAAWKAWLACELTA